MPKLKTKKTYKYKRKSRNSFSFHGGLFSNLPFFILSSSLAALLLLVVAFKYSDKLNISVLSSLTRNDAGKTRFYPPLDPRLSVVHAAGSFPFIKDDFLQYGANKAYTLGFRNIEIWMSPSLCNVDDSMTYGFYQNRKWCENDSNRFKSDMTLKKLASDNIFLETFNMPFSTFIINVDVLNSSSLNQYKVSTSKVLATDKQIDSLYNEVYEFADHLLNTYKGTNKRFVLVFGNEIENRITPPCNQPFLINKNPNLPNCDTVDANTTSVTNAITWLNTVSKAIDDAEKDNNDVEGIELLHATEVNHVLSKDVNAKSALTDVLPNTNLDLYSYSAYEIQYYYNLDNTKRPAVMMIQALNKIAKYAPDSEKFGNKNIFIGEIGYNKLKNNGDKNLKIFSYPIKAALNWGVPYVNYWQLFDSSCKNFIDSKDFNQNDCNGFWLVGPNNKVSSIYEKVISEFSASKNHKQNYFNNSAFMGMTVNGEPLIKYRKGDNKFHLPLNEDLTFRINFRNIGNIPWNKKNNYLLQRIDYSESKLGFGYQINLPQDVVVNPGNNFIFEFKTKITKPLNTKVSWKMKQIGIEDFGKESFIYDLVFEDVLKKPSNVSCDILKNNNNIDFNSVIKFGDSISYDDNYLPQISMDFNIKDLSLGGTSSRFIVIREDKIGNDLKVMCSNANNIRDKITKSRVYEVTKDQNLPIKDTLSCLSNFNSAPSYKDNSSKPFAVIVMLGTNDVFRDRTPENILLNRYEKILDIFISQGIIPIVNKIPPHTSFKLASDKIQRLNDKLEEMARNKGLSIVETSKYLEDSERDVKPSTPNNVHFKPSAYKDFNMYLNNLLKRKQAEIKRDCGY